MEPCICCVKQFVESLTKDIDNKKDAAIYIREYIDALSRKLFRAKSLDVSDICSLAFNYKSLTRKEKARLLSEALHYIYNEM